MPLALFDLDNTLLAGDGDYLWGCFLVQQGLVDKDLYEQANQRFYQDYQQGSLDIHEFLNFALAPLEQHDTALLQKLHTEFMERTIRPIMNPAGVAQIEKHRARGDRPVIITATNRFVTGPIAAAFGIEDLIATEPEMVDGRYTGNVAGIPCFQHGKTQRLRQWMQQTGTGLENSWFYSDSFNDLDLLQQVTHPVAVDPDPRLLQTAAERGWRVMSFR